MIWQAFVDGFSIFIEQWPLVLAALVVMVLGLGPVLKGKTITGQSILLLIFFFFVSVILRLAFMTGTVVPPYFDSVEHFRLAKELVIALESSTILEAVPTLTTGYYHLGFHVLAALLTFGLHADPIVVILILGQVTLATIPIPIFFLIRRETQNVAAAFFGMLLAGFGWYMPGFAVNWGKYPALTGLLAMELVLSFAYFVFHNKQERNRNTLSILLILGILVSTLFHSRTLIVIIISVVGWIIAGKIQSLSKYIQYVSQGILLATTLVLGMLIQGEPLLDLALDPYLDDGIWVTITVITLSLFALIKFPRWVYFSTLFICLVFAALFVPVDSLLPGLENQTLLDRPFVEMILYLPLALLGGLGFAGILRFIQGIKAIPEKIRMSARILVTILVIGVAGILPISRYGYYPSDCCNFVGNDDAVMFDWLMRNTPSDAYILIASTQMHVLPSGPSAASVGTDAGIWIPALTGRTTSFATFNTDFRSESTLEKLCQEQIGYVYVGGIEHSFNAEQLQSKPNWYEPILSLPNAQLYEMIGCVKK